MCRGRDTCLIDDSFSSSRYVGVTPYTVQISESLFSKSDSTPQFRPYTTICRQQSPKICHALFALDRATVLVSNFPFMVNWQDFQLTAVFTCLSVQSYIYIYIYIYSFVFYRFIDFPMGDHRRPSAFFVIRTLWFEF